MCMYNHRHAVFFLEIFFRGGSVFFEIFFRGGGQTNILRNRGGRRLQLKCKIQWQGQQEWTVHV